MGSGQGWLFYQQHFPDDGAFIDRQAVKIDAARVVRSVPFVGPLTGAQVRPPASNFTSEIVVDRKPDARTTGRRYRIVVVGLNGLGKFCSSANSPGLPSEGPLTAVVTVVQDVGEKSAPSPATTAMWWLPSLEDEGALVHEQIAQAHRCLEAPGRMEVGRSPGLAMSTDSAIRPDAKRASPPPGATGVTHIGGHHPAIASASRASGKNRLRRRWSWNSSRS